MKGNGRASRESESEARLAERARAGDERAFELIVRRHRAGLVAYCHRLGLGDGRAEDAVQQAFLSAWLALRRGAVVRDPGAWLGRITHNKAVNLLRAGAGADGVELIGEPATRAGVEERLDLRQTLAAVAALPPRQRDALVLSAVEGRSYEEVAGTLGVSAGAVRGLLHRPRETLRAAAGALAPLPFVRGLGGWLRRACLPAGRLAEAASPASVAGPSAAGLRVLAAAATSAVIAAGVAVGPGLLAGRHAHPRKPGHVPALAHALTVPAGARPRARGGAPARGDLASYAPSGTAPTATRRSLPGAAPRSPAPAPAPDREARPARPAREEPAAAIEEPGVSPSPSTAAAASSQVAEPSPEAPSAPAPEQPPVTVQPEAPAHEEEPREKEEEDRSETPAPGEPERPPRKDE